MATEVEQLYLQLELFNIEEQMLILQMLKRRRQRRPGKILDFERYHVFLVLFWSYSLIAHMCWLFIFLMTQVGLGSANLTKCRHSALIGFGCINPHANTAFKRKQTLVFRKYTKSGYVSWAHWCLYVAALKRSLCFSVRHSYAVDVDLYTVAWRAPPKNPNYTSSWRKGCDWSAQNVISGSWFFRS